VCGVVCVGDAAHPTTPNLGQGGCLALEDAVVLARALGGVLSSDSITTQAQREAVERALRGYEAERSRRCLQLTVRLGGLDGMGQGQGGGGRGGRGSSFVHFSFLQPRSHQERCGTKIY
jgi:2-polyprenyl-6-methoxyphenol hydroxylase-like FAD-dependent oxidoreductase